MDIFAASDLNNEALELESEGDLIGAEKKHLAALELKMNSAFRTDIGVALTQNGLGELYLKMGKLEQAQEMLEKSYKARGCKYFFLQKMPLIYKITLLLKLTVTLMPLAPLITWADSLR